MGTHATYGSCDQSDMDGADVYDTTSWTLTLYPSRCGMEGKLRNLIYNQSAEFTLGGMDGGIEITFAKLEVSSYCNYTSEYTVNFGYGVNVDQWDFADSGGL